jgi:hypothetical protein
LILFKSEILVTSLALLLYQANDVNAIVHKIAKIAITTINSTNVKPKLFLNNNVLDL